MSLDLNFSKEQLHTFDNAIDLVYSKGYVDEVKFQDEKVIGVTLITYAVMRGPKGDILVQMSYTGDRGCRIQFFQPTDTGKIEITAKEIREMPNVE